jgi:DNA-binding MarR family transcriptional regulator
MTAPRRPAAARRPRPAPAPPPPADDDQRAPAARDLLEALQAVARELRLTERRGRAPLGLPPAQLRALRELAARPAASLAELAERTYTDPSSASVVVQRLVERGLVVRVDSEHDRRRTELRATPAGRALVSRAPADAVARVADALTPLGERQAATMSRGLMALARGLRAAQDEDATQPVG